MARIGSGPSGGCRTCRRRRVKCDEKQPACARCEKGEFQCDGYIRDHRFVDENSRVDRRVKRTVETSRSTTPVAVERSSPESTELVALFEKSSTLSLSPDLGLQGFEDDIFTSYLLSHFLAGWVMFPEVPWLRLHAEEVSSRSAKACIRALGSVYFGRVHHQNYITDRGNELYGQALIALNDDLRTEEKAWSVPVVRSAMVLELYEFIAFESTSGWMKHAGGVGRLIQLRGPLRHQTVPERMLLEGNRVTIALECLIKRKRCFLEHPDWKTIPWAEDPASKAPISQLHDFLCDIPGLMEDANALQSASRDSVWSEAGYLLLSHKIVVLLKALYEWRVPWAKKNSLLCYEVPSSYPQTKQISPSVFWFGSLGHANEVILYDAILLLVLRLGSNVIGTTFDASIPALGLPTNLKYHPLHATGTVSSHRAVALEICKSVEYFLATGTSAGAFFLLFPMRVAWQAFQPASREAQWLGQMMTRVSDASGFEVLRAPRDVYVEHVD